MALLSDPSSELLAGRLGDCVLLTEDAIYAGAPSTHDVHAAAGIVLRLDLFTLELMRIYRSPNPTRRGEFGSSIAVRSQVALIGAPGADSEVPDEAAGGGFIERASVGEAYLFDTTSGQLLATFKNPDATTINRFGEACALTLSHALIGAPLNLDRAGAVYASLLNTGGPYARLMSPTPQAQEHFGAALALLPDRVLIGAPGSAGQGSVHAFDSITLERRPGIASPLSGHRSFFGGALAVRESIIAIGAPMALSSGVLGGAVQLFDPESGVLLRELRPPAPQDGAEFGAALALSDKHLLVGAPGDVTALGQRAGRVYVFDWRTGGLLLDLEPPAPTGNDEFGREVAFFRSNLLVGAPGYASGRGAILILEGPDAGAFDPCQPARLGPRSADCNANGSADSCDIQQGASSDCDLDGRPDECQLPGEDCNSNSIPDACDISQGLFGDCNEDGIPDICQLADRDCNENLVLDECETDERYSISMASSFVDPVGHGGPGIVAIDHDRDGRTDLLLSSTGPPDLVLLEPAGDRHFRFASTFDAGAQGALRMATADFDQDGIDDVVTSNLYSNSSSILHGRPGGGFSTPKLYAVGELPGPCVAVDFDQDSWPDFAALCGGRQLALLHNRGDGTVLPPQPVHDEPSTEGFAAGDLDGDGHADLAIASRGGVHLLFNARDRSFHPPVQAPPGTREAEVLCLADVDSDGDLDVLHCNEDYGEIDILDNQGGGEFLRRDGPVGFGSVVLRAVEFNDDGRVDFLVRGAIGAALLSRDEGASHELRPLPTGPVGSELYAVDLNGDGSQDVHWRSSEGVRVLWNEPGLGLPGYSPFPVPSTLVSSALKPHVADFTADGHQDILVQRRVSNLTLASLSLDSGQWTGRSLPFGSVPRQGVSVADITGDGSLDIVSHTHQTRILANDGLGFFSELSVVDMDGDCAGILSADLDADGSIDVVGANPVSDSSKGTGTHSSVAVSLNEGGGLLASPSVFRPLPAPHELAIADFDGNGWRDVAALTAMPLGLTLLLQDGAMDFAERSLAFSEYAHLDGNGNPGAITATDIDGDGDMDLLVLVADAEALLVLENDGAGVFPRRREYPLGVEAVHLTTSDVDGDGRVDILVSDSMNSSLILLESTHEGELLWRGRFSPGGAPAGTAAIDLDADGLMDVVACLQAEGRVALFPGRVAPSAKVDTDHDGVPDECGAAAAGGIQHLGDCNQDGRTDLSDGICVLGFLFAGRPLWLPCGNGGTSDSGNLTLLDTQRDGRIDLSDAVATLQYLFLGVPSALFLEEARCRQLPGCPEAPACP